NRRGILAAQRRQLQRRKHTGEPEIRTPRINPQAAANGYAPSHPHTPTAANQAAQPPSPPDTHALAHHGHSHDAAPASQPPLRASRRYHHPETRDARRQSARAETAPTWHHSPPHARQAPANQPAPSH